MGKIFKATGLFNNVSRKLIQFQLQMSEIGCSVVTSGRTGFTKFFLCKQTAIHCKDLKSFNKREVERISCSGEKNHLKVIYQLFSLNKSWYPRNCPESLLSPIVQLSCQDESFLLDVLVYVTGLCQSLCLCQKATGKDQEFYGWQECRQCFDGVWCSFPSPYL